MDQTSDFLINLRSKVLHSGTPDERCNTDAARRAGNMQRISRREVNSSMRSCGWCIVRRSQH